MQPNEDPPNPLDPDKLSFYLDRCVSLIEEHGHMVQSVLSDGGLVGFSYTVGLSLSLNEELLVIGLPPTLATAALNGVARALAGGDPGATDLEIGLNVPVRLRECPKEEASRHLPLVGVLLPKSPGRIRQVIWPDPNGYFPGDPNYRHLIQQSLDELEPARRNH